MIIAGKGCVTLIVMMDGAEENGCVDSTQQPIINLKQRLPHSNSIKPFPIYFHHVHISENNADCIY